MEFFIFILYILSTITFLKSLQLLIRSSRTSPKLPPGPVPLPVIGSLLKLGDKPHKSLAELAKIYGPIMCLKLGRKTTVVISSPALAQEVLQKQDLAFSTRSIPNAVHAHGHNKYSTVWLPVADQWRSLRKALNSNIFSGNRLDASQNLRRQKVQELIEYAGKCCKEGVTVDIGSAVFKTSLNLLSNTIFSIDMADPTQDSVKQFRHLIWEIMVEIGKPNFVDYFLVLEKIDPQGIRHRLTNHFGKIFELFSQLIDERLELRRLGKSGAENDVIDILLNITEVNGEINRTHIEHLCLLVHSSCCAPFGPSFAWMNAQNSNKIGELFTQIVCFQSEPLKTLVNGLDYVHSSCYAEAAQQQPQDIFAAGTDTTSSSVEWAMAELLRNPETLKKAKAELEQTIGKGKPIEESDIPRLPYLQAIVKETMRIHPPAPLLIPRTVETDVEVYGYTVPQGAQVLVNAWAIGHDPSVWENPTSFMPERFLDLDIDVRGRDFELIPFGGGRRICPGLSLAIRVIPHMLGSLINSFDWKLEGGIKPEELDMDDKFGLTVQKAQPLRIVPLPM